MLPLVTEIPRLTVGKSEPDSRTLRFAGFLAPASQSEFGKVAFSAHKPLKSAGNRCSAHTELKDMRQICAQHTSRLGLRTMVRIKKLTKKQFQGANIKRPISRSVQPDRKLQSLTLDKI